MGIAFAFKSESAMFAASKSASILVSLSSSSVLSIFLVRAFILLSAFFMSATMSCKGTSSWALRSCLMGSLTSRLLAAAIAASKIWLTPFKAIPTLCMRPSMPTLTPISVSFSVKPNLLARRAMPWAFFMTSPPLTCLPYDV